MDAPSTFGPPTYPKRRPRSFVFPMLLVVVGIVLLMNNLGILPWSVWTALGQLWPAILILLGIDLLVGRRSTWLGAALAAFTFVGVLGVAIVMTFSGFTPSASSVTAVPLSDASIPLNGATSGQVAIQFGAGELKVGALAPGGTDLAQVTASLPGSTRLTHQSTVRGNVVDATIGTTGSGGWPFRGFDRGGNATMDAQLAPKVPLVVRAEMGAGQSDFDLTDLSVQQFTLNNGAGQATIHFPKSAGQTTADIHSGAGQITLEIPAGVGAYIHGSNGLVNLHAADRYQKVGDGYQTSDFASAPNRVDVTLHVGIGEVDVQ